MGLGGWLSGIENHHSESNIVKNCAAIHKGPWQVSLPGTFKTSIQIKTPTLYIVASRSSSNTPDIRTMASASSKLPISSITSSSFSKLTG